MCSLSLAVPVSLVGVLLKTTDRVQLASNVLAGLAGHWLGVDDVVGVGDEFVEDNTELQPGRKSKNMREYRGFIIIRKIRDMVLSVL